VAGTAEKPRLLGNNHLYIPARGDEPSYITTMPMGEGLTYEGVLPDGRVAFREDPEKGSTKGKYYFLKPSEFPRIFRKPTADEHLINALDLPLKLSGVPLMEEGEPVLDYMTRLAPQAAEIAAMEALPLGAPVLRKGAGWLEQTARRAAPSLARAAKVVGVGVPASLISHGVRGDVPSVGEVAGETVPIPATEMGLRGALTALGNYIRPFFTTKAQYGEVLQKPGPAALTKSLGETRVPGTLGEITDEPSRRYWEAKMAKTGAGAREIRAAAEEQMAARQAHVQRTLEPMQRRVPAGETPPSSMSVGAEIQKPIRAIKDKIVALQKEQAGVERKNAEIAKRNAEKVDAIKKRNEALLKKHDEELAGFPEHVRKEARKIREGQLEKPPPPEKLLEFDPQKKEQLEDLKSFFSKEEFPKLAKILTIEDPGDAAKIFAKKETAELSSYMRFLNDPIAQEVLGERQAVRSRNAVRLAFMQNVLGMPEGAEMPDFKGVNKRLRLTPQAQIDIINGRFDSKEIPTVLKDFFSDEEGQQQLRFLADVSMQAEHLGRYKSDITHPTGILSRLGQFGRNLIGSMGLAKAVFTPEGQTWIREAEEISRTSRSAGRSERILNWMRRGYLVKKTVDTYFQTKPGEAERPAEAIEQAAGGVQ